MARDIDRVIELVRQQDYIPPVHLQVIINRIDAGPPSAGELVRATEQVYPNG